MLEQLSATEVKEMLAYAYIDSGAYKKSQEKENRVMANNLRDGFNKLGVVKRG